MADVGVALAMAGVGLVAGLVAAAFARRWPRAPDLSDASAVAVRWRAGQLWVLALAALAAVQPDPVAGLHFIVFGMALVFLALVDLRRFTLPFSGLALLGLAIAFGLTRLSLDEALQRLATGLAIFVLFAALWWFSRGPKRRAIGWGDVLLAGLVGALVGWRLAPMLLALAALTPLAVQRLTRRRGPVPFGFWLCLFALPAAAWNGLHGG